MGIRNLYLKNRLRFVVYIVTAILVLAGLGVGAKAYYASKQIQKENQIQIKEDKLFDEAFAKFLEVKALLELLQKVGLNVEAFEQEYESLRDLLNSGMYSLSIDKANSLLQLVNLFKGEFEGVLKGNIKDGDTPIKDCTLELLIGEEKAYEAVSGESGEYEFKPVENTYTFKIVCAGFKDVEKEITIRAGEELIDEIAAKVPVIYVPRPAPAPVAAPAPATSGASTANSTYEHKNVDTAVGSFAVDVMRFNLGSGGIRVVTDTAADGDCADSCPTTSLANMVSRNGGFAGIHGTYFCPTDYGVCAGKTNSFFWKILNPRIGMMINATNDLGEWNDYYAFSASGYPTFYYAWILGKDGGHYSGINSGPSLIRGRASVLNFGTLDDKQKYTKSNRGAIGLQGTTLIAMIASGATVPDTVDIMLALGADTATEIDGGGSVAMYYNGSYKKGPGRSLPNGIVFVGN